MAAKVLGAVKESLGMFLHSLEFLEPQGPMVEEIERFVRALQLQGIRRS